MIAFRLRHDLGRVQAAPSGGELAAMGEKRGAAVRRTKFEDREEFVSEHECIRNGTHLTMERCRFIGTGFSGEEPSYCSWDLVCDAEEVPIRFCPFCGMELSYCPYACAMTKRPAVCDCRPPGARKLIKLASPE